MDPGCYQHAGVRWTIVQFPTTVDGQHVAAGSRVFKFNRPSCPNGCPKRPWGHGWVSRYFAAAPDAVRVQRFRCPGCGAVITPRPDGFWARYQTPAAEIASVLARRLSTKRWPLPGARQRAGHWLRRLVAGAAFESPGEDPLAFLARLHRAGIRFLV